MTYEYIAYVSSGNVNNGEEVLRVTAEGEFVWNENADEMIASGDYSQYPSLRHVLKALRENERLREALQWIARRCPTDQFLDLQPHRIHLEAAHDAGACARAALKEVPR